MARWAFAWVTSGVVLISACGPVVFPQRGRPRAETAADRQMDALSSRYIDDLFRLEPVSGTRRGLHRWDAFWPDRSPAGRAHALAVHAEYQKSLRQIDAQTLSDERAADHAAMNARVQRAIFELSEAQAYKHDVVAVLQEVWDGLTLATSDDAALARLAALPTYLDQTLDSRMLPTRISVQVALTRGELRGRFIARKFACTHPCPPAALQGAHAAPGSVAQRFEKMDKQQLRASHRKGLEALTQLVRHIEQLEAGQHSSTGTVTDLAPFRVGRARWEATVERHTATSVAAEDVFALAMKTLVDDRQFLLTRSSTAALMSRPYAGPPPLRPVECPRELDVARLCAPVPKHVFWNADVEAGFKLIGRDDAIRLERLRAAALTAVDIRIHAGAFDDAHADSWAMQILTDSAFLRPEQAANLIVMSKLRPAQSSLPFCAYLALSESPDAQKAILRLGALPIAALRR